MSTSDQALLAKSVKSYEMALSKDETLVDTHLNLAIVQVALGQADKGLERLNSLRARSDFHGNIELELAKANDALGKYEEAIKYYQTVVDSDEKNQEVKRQLATAYFKNDELDKSREILEKLSELTREMPDFSRPSGTSIFAKENSKRQAKDSRQL